MLIQYDIDLLNIWINSLKYISMIQKNSIQESLSISAPTKHNFTYFTQFTESFPWVGRHQTSTTTLKAGACRDEFTTLKEYKLPLSWSKSSCYTCPLPLCCSATQRPAKQVAQRFCFGRSNLWYSNSWTGHYALIALANRFPRILPRPWKNNWMHVLEMCSTTFDIYMPEWNKLKTPRYHLQSSNSFHIHESNGKDTINIFHAIHDHRIHLTPFQSRSP